MNKTLTAIAALAMSIDATWAADIVSGYYGNTMVAVNPQGKTSRVMFKPDHSFAGSTETGGPLSGTWELVGDKMCYAVATPAPPPNSPNPTCTSFGAHNIGDEWTFMEGTIEWKATLVRGQ
jgi:hypothetical protein